MTTATFGDWLLRCRQVAAGQSARSCEVIQSVESFAKAAENAVAEAAKTEFSLTESTTQKHSQDGSVPFTLDRVPAGNLPQGSGLLHGQPISKPHAQLFRPFHAPNTSGQIRAQQSGVRRLIRETSDCGKPHVNGPWRQQAIFEMNPVAGHHRFVEGQPRFGAVPPNEVVVCHSVVVLIFRRLLERWNRRTNSSSIVTTRFRTWIDASYDLCKSRQGLVT
jgi:hypothetical protein